MGEPKNSGKIQEESPRATRTLTERQVLAALGLDRLQLHLAAANLHVGRFDTLTHLKVFTLEEVERIAVRLGVPVPKIAEDPQPENTTDLQSIPEPHGE